MFLKSCLNMIQQKKNEEGKHWVFIKTKLNWVNHIVYSTKINSKIFFLIYILTS